MTDRTTVMSWLEGLAQDDWRMFHSDSEVQYIARSALGVLKEQDSIVRCKDCVHWEKGYTEDCCNSDSVCFHNGRCKPDWFCADGERKDDDG